VGKAPKATAVIAVLKNDFMLISLFIFYSAYRLRHRHHVKDKMIIHYKF